MKKPHATHWIALVGIVAGMLIISLCAAHAHTTYRNRIVSNVRIAGIDLSGMDALAASSLLQRAYADMITNGLEITVENSTKTVELFSAQSDDIAYNLLDWDANAAVQEALVVGHHTNIVADSLLTLYYAWFGQKSFGANITVNTTRLRETMLAAFPEAQLPATATDFVVKLSRGKEPVVTVREGVDGQTLNIDGAAIQAIRRDAQNLSLKPHVISAIPLAPSMALADAETLIPAAIQALTSAPYTTSATNTENKTQAWTVSQKTIADWIIPTKQTDGTLSVGLESEKMLKFLTEIHNAIDVSAKNARFTISDGKVSEFQGSTEGIVLDDDAFFAQFASALGTSTTNTPITIATRTELPSVTTENVNGLGISQIVGEASTTFPHSTANRAQNIQHGAEKLNGILIAPGEIVSTLALLRPFTLSDGYVSELVIKGDEIKAEVGGGLCQLGTTMFRSVMATGLEVVSRRNHSLAISYYDDATNGNPGTDATLYDPAPDFTFKNDMATYILLITTVNIETETVTFTFWGTKDGRSGSYSPPEVLTRTPAGATRYTDSAALALGEERCQNAFPGYTTTFDYTIIYADGTTKVTPFLSDYRALPKMCVRGTAVQTVATTEE